ncbi:protein neprosin-like [Aristolochia californica]|uniref:protein neprosin-like n=1 Tax=Aristolochia californica TaxID=171875 RepID=UPI0035DA1508
MALMGTIVVFSLVASAMIVTSNGAQEKLSVEEDLELERQMKILNKPAVKTIKTEYGDIFDCVDIHKQPAFDHPLLKNHKLQTSPSFIPEARKQGAPSMATTAMIGLPDGGCPQGSVPIRRIQKQELKNARMFFNYSNEATMPTANHPGAAYSSTVRWRGNEKLYGTRFLSNVWGHQLKEDQCSSACTWVQNGCDSINAGWMVSPNLFGDSRTRLFIYWTADCYKKTGCYNTFCPGFVQIDTEMPLGAFIRPLSNYEGSQFDIQLDVFKDLSSDGTWWLVYNGIRPVGYWPMELFSKLPDHAETMAWGGYVYGPKARPSPPMGSGYFAHFGYGRACFFRNIQLMDNFRAFYDPQEGNLRYGSNSQCYDWSGSCEDGSWGCGLYFGGPGC